MNALGMAIGAALWLWAVASGIAFCLVGMAPGWVLPKTVGEALKGEPQVLQFAAVCGAAVTVVAFAGLLRAIVRWRRTAELRWDDGLGPTSLSLAAVEECLGRALEEEEMIRHVDVKIAEIPPDRRLEIVANVSMWEVPNLPEQIQLVRGRLKERFDRLLPDRENVTVALRVRKLVPRGPRRTTGAEADAPSAGRDFRVPEMPIDGDAVS